jgi:hypothetical protein
MRFIKSQIHHEYSGESLTGDLVIRPLQQPRGIGFVSAIQPRLAMRVVAILLLIIGGSATAKAQCGNSLNEMAAAAAAARGRASSTQVMPKREFFSVTDSAVDTKIVGLWHIRFMVGDQTIQEAFQIWNQGGTEVHNPNVDPRGGNVCLGTWEKMSHRSFKLNHRVWNYDINGNYMGTIHLTETVTVSGDGATHGGTFSLAFFDPDGNFLMEVPGDVVAERITVDQP